MAKRKQKGAAFGKKSGSGSQVTFQKKERSRVGLYTLIGIMVFVILCFALFVTSGGLDLGGGTAQVDDSNVLDDGFESETDSAETGDEGSFSASSDSVDEVPADSSDDSDRPFDHH